MRDKLINLSILLLLTFGVITPSYAYLDPGSGSVLLQGLFAGVAGMLAVLKIYWQRLKDYWQRLISKKAASSNHEKDTETKQ